MSYDFLLSIYIIKADNAILNYAKSDYVAAVNPVRIVKH